MTEKHLWWKCAGILLFLYVLTCGLLTPLKHGIQQVVPDRLKAGEFVSLLIQSYNANYLEGNTETNHRNGKAADSIIQVYLKHVSSNTSKTESADYMVMAEQLEIIDHNTIKASFQLPKHLPDERKVALFSLIVNDPFDGATVIPSKIIILQDSVNLKDGILAWTLPQMPKFFTSDKFRFPYRNILVETIRNTFFHVSLWFAMFLMFGMSVYYSIKYLKLHDPDADLRSHALVRTGLLFGILGCLTGSLWARYTWETWWTTDIKLNMAALTMLIYISYLVLRAAIEDKDRMARIAAAYNIFALVAVIPLIFILPRLTDSLHPGNGGNPAFGSDDMDHTLRIVFYPAVLGFIFIGLWLASILYRIDKTRSDLDELENI